MERRSFPFPSRPNFWCIEMRKMKTFLTLILTAAGLTLMSRPVHAAAGNPLLRFEADNQPLVIGDPLTVQVVLDTKSRTVSAVELHIQFSTHALHGLSIQKGSFLEKELSAGGMFASSATITLGCDPSMPVTGVGTIAVLTFTVLSEDSPQLNFDAQTKLAVIGADGNTVDVMSPLSTITLAGESLASVRVYPNPVRVARGDNHLMFDQMPAGSTVKIYTVSGRWVKTLPAPSGSVSWDLLNDSGDRVASGIYLYLAADAQGNKSRGKFTVIK